jgi:hypothetical protein
MEKESELRKRRGRRSLAEGRQHVADQSHGPLAFYEHRMARNRALVEKGIPLVKIKKKKK